MTEFTLGTRASCSDGFCGVVSRAILDPAARTVTHLVIGPRLGETEVERHESVHAVDDPIGQVENLPSLDPGGRSTS